MWSECLDIFEHLLEEQGEDLILADYIPADGTYIIVDSNGNCCTSCDIKLDKKSGKIQKGLRHQDICFFDYFSRLSDMNKPIDKKKVIHSNNYLSFFIKKESLTNGKLTAEIINEYYKTLENPYLKYSKGPSKQLYQSVEDKLGPVDTELLHKNRMWIIENISSFHFEGGKTYLKIFFDAPKALYEREGSRYFIPNIYNNNDFNLDLGIGIYGASNNNFGMNAKKPYLANRTRKVSTPYMISEKEAFLQKRFMDYLMNFAAKGQNNIFIDYDRKKILGYSDFTKNEVDNGYFLRIQKGKEVEIHYQNVIVAGEKSLERPFDFCNHLQVGIPEDYVEKVGYKEYFTKTSLYFLIDEVFFNKYLNTNMFIPIDKLTISNKNLKEGLIQCRERIFNWSVLGSDDNLWRILDRTSRQLLLGNIDKNFIFKAMAQFNLRWSLKKHFEGERHMERDLIDYYKLIRKKINSDEIESIESDEEFYYGVGQLVRYFISLNKSNTKTHSLANPYFNASEISVIKTKLKQMFKKYNYEIWVTNKQFNKLYEMISMYQPIGDVNDDMMIAGYLSRNMIYDSNQEKAKDKGESKNE